MFKVKKLGFIVVQWELIEKQKNKQYRNAKVGLVALRRKLINVSRGEYKSEPVAERDIKLGYKVSVQYRVSEFHRPNKTASDFLA